METLLRIDETHGLDARIIQDDAGIHFELWIECPDGGGWERHATFPDTVSGYGEAIKTLAASLLTTANMVSEVLDSESFKGGEA